jgi:hypothetical protein
MSRGRREATSPLPLEVEVLIGDRNNPAELGAIKNRDWGA